MNPWSCAEGSEQLRNSVRKCRQHVGYLVELAESLPITPTIASDAIRKVAHDQFGSPAQLYAGVASHWECRLQLLIEGFAAA